MVSLYPYMCADTNAVDVLVVRHVKQGTETAGLGTGSARHLRVCLLGFTHASCGILYKYTVY